MSYTENSNGNPEITKESNYYPFGLKHKGYNTNISSLGNSTAQLLGFTGKEEQDELGLGWIDITARNYNPELGRWMNIDPLAEQMRRHSPYNYAFDNPIYFMDPDGMKPFGGQQCCGDKKKPRPTTGQIMRFQRKKIARQIKKGLDFVSNLIKGGFMFTKGSNDATGDPNLIRKAPREQAKDVEMVDMEGFIDNAASFAKLNPKSKSKGDRKTNAPNKANKKENWATNFNKGRNHAKDKTTKVWGVTEKIGKTADKVMNLLEESNEEPDTTMTITTNEVTEIVPNDSGGNAVYSKEFTRDTTVNRSQTGNVTNFVNQQNANTKKQIDDILSNNN